MPAPTLGLGAGEGGRALHQPLQPDASAARAVAPAAAAPAAPLPPVRLGTRLAFGLGAVANGVKENGFSYFLLLFYSQVVGLDARLVGLAITVALLLDAVSDPLVGTWSDNTRSRLGRRHPFMYAAAIPLPLAFFFLWSPPLGWSQAALFWYLLLLAVTIRTFMTFFEVPSSALTPELTQDYDQRASLLSLRFYFGWTGGNAMTVLTFGAIFPAFATAAIADGRFNPEAYRVFGLVAAAVIFLSVMTCALGTHARIPHLMPPPPRRPVSPGRFLRDLSETLGTRSFVALFVATLFGAVASGLAASLAFYLNIFFWRFSSQQIALLTLGIFLSALLGGLVAPAVSRRLGKRRGAIAVGLVAFLGAPLPILLRVAGILPSAAEAPWVFWIVATATVLDVGLIIAFQILSAAMIADLVEQAELRTGRRSEGTFFAAVSFSRKAVTGIGVTVASLLLAAAGLREGLDPSQVPEAVSLRLGALYAPTVLALWLAMIAVLSLYRLERADHEANLAALAARRAAP